MITPCMKLQVAEHLQHALLILYRALRFVWQQTAKTKILTIGAANDWFGAFELTLSSVIPRGKFD